jgi:chromosome segregation ATPase
LDTELTSLKHDHADLGDKFTAMHKAFDTVSDAHNLCDSVQADLRDNVDELEHDLDERTSEVEALKATVAELTPEMEAKRNTLVSQQLAYWKEQKRREEDREHEDFKQRQSAYNDAKGAPKSRRAQRDQQLADSSNGAFRTKGPGSPMKVMTLNML